MTTPRATLIPVALAAALLAGPALAQSAGEWTVGIGAASVQPKGDNGRLAGTYYTEVGNDVRPSLTLEYFVRDNVGVELLAATPFEHEVKFDGVGKVGTVKHLPPTLSLNYHFETNTPFKPYIGAGLNWTSFWGEKTSGPLAGADLDLKHSFGVALQAGADYWVNDKSAIRGTLRWIDIDSDVYLNGAKVGTVEIDPLVVQAAYVMKF